MKSSSEIPIGCLLAATALSQLGRIIYRRVRGWVDWVVISSGAVPVRVVPSVERVPLRGPQGSVREVIVPPRAREVWNH